MEFWWLGLLVVVLFFAGVVFFGAPYLPTLTPQVETAFELLQLQPGQTLLELGCGDGKVLLAAARAGYNAVGIELNPLLVAVAWWRTRKYRRQVRVRWGSFWSGTWPKADGVYVFLIDRFMPKLDARMHEYKKPLVSITFTIPGRKYTAEKNGVFLYDYR